MSYGSLCKREVIVAWSTWQSTDAQGVVKINIPVTPSYGHATSIVYPTTMGYVAAPFTYWRGTMRYRVVIGCSSAHRGSLQIFWNPDNTNVTASDITNSLMNHIVDVSANNEVIFDVGYNNAAPYLRTGFTTGAAYDAAKANGLFSIKVLNPLRAQATSSVQIVVYASMLDDVQLQGITNFQTSTVTSSTLHRMVVQGAVGDEPVKTRTLSLAPSMGVYPPEISFGECFSSVRALMQKPSRLFGGGNPSNPNGSCSIILDQLGPIPAVVTPSSNFPKNAFTFARYYAMMYAGISTSEKIRVITNANCVVRGCQMNDTNYIFNELHSYNSVTAGLSGEELRFPYYSPRKFMDPSYYFKSAGGAAYGRHNNRVIVTPIVAGDMYAQFYYSFGPDIRVTYFRQTLGIAIQTDPGTDYAAAYQTPNSYNSFPAPAALADPLSTRAVGQALEARDEDEEANSYDDGEEYDDPREAEGTGQYRVQGERTVTILNIRPPRGIPDIGFKFTNLGVTPHGRTMGHSRTPVIF
jgi:hypothetical protein